MQQSSPRGSAPVDSTAPLCHSCYPRDSPAWQHRTLGVYLRHHIVIAHNATWGGCFDPSASSNTTAPLSHSLTKGVFIPASCVTALRSQHRQKGNLWWKTSLRAFLCVSHVWDICHFYVGDGRSLFFPFHTINGFILYAFMLYISSHFSYSKVFLRLYEHTRAETPHTLLIN